MNNWILFMGKGVIIWLTSLRAYLNKKRIWTNGWRCTRGMRRVFPRRGEARRRDIYNCDFTNSFRLHGRKLSFLTPPNNGGNGGTAHRCGTPCLTRKITGWSAWKGHHPDVPNVKTAMRHFSLHVTREYLSLCLFHCILSQLRRTPNSLFHTISWLSSFPPTVFFIPLVIFLFLTICECMNTKHMNYKLLDCLTFFQVVINK